MQFEAFSEKKTLREWAQDERCQVSEMTLRKNIQAGIPMEQAFQYRRKPGRHFIGAHEDFSGEVNELKAALHMLANGGELWVYTSPDMNRISLIHKDARHTITNELFSVMTDQSYVMKAFETDTIKNFELTDEGHAAAN